ncbi:HNH endonuclease [Mycolicibacter terrae]|uniref:HNH endonuclease n=1 Tax=Mycolicibacter terrae TaxID=1788 RepID=A0ACD2EQH4_9MYCO|nr:HNH endonuclease signature motif containing protein [Mycolicibacter terrae]RRR47166.1 HNH endonuclease [Mycolicibacter terrae]
MFESASDLLSPTAPAGLSPAQLGELIAAVHRTESVLVARRLGAIAALLRRHGGADPWEFEQDHETVTGYERTCAQVSALMNLAPAAAGRQVHYAAALDNRLPRVGELFARGHLDWHTVQLIITRTDLVDDDLIGGLDEHLAARAGGWSSWSRRRIINAVDAAVLEVDPDAARQRRKEADNDRYLWVSPERDGMAEIKGKIAAAQGAAFDRRLTQMANDVCADDPRTLDQRRVDALNALAEGLPLICACGRSDCPARAADRPSPGSGTRVILNVVATADTIGGCSDRPGYLEGFGVIDADQVRALAESASRWVIDATVDAAAALRYRPSVQLARAVRCRDLTCRFPGCHRRATICDLDHTVPFNHDDPAAGGPTAAWNLKCLCRFHHRMKTFGGWSDRQSPDGTVIWTSPTGVSFETKPGSADVIPELADALSLTVQRPLPQRCRSRARQRAAQVARVRRHNRARRAANERYAARRREIEDRKWRNRMRDTLFLLKGTKSASPFCGWINDPHEPEELPPDWQPPPPSPPLPDDPPF